MNPNSDIDRGRLFKSMQVSYRSLRWARQLVRGLTEEYVGPGYGNEARTKREMLVNLINQTVEAATMSLVANRPKVLLTTEHPELEYFSNHFQAAINSLIKEIRLEEVLQRWVLDAFFCVGIVKVHLADSGFVMGESNMAADPGIPFASNISIDNWGFDPGAKLWHEVRFAYDTYRIPFEDLKDEVIYDQSVVKDLMPTSKLHIDQERLEQISKGNEVDFDEFEPMVDLVDVWVVRDEKIYTFAVDNRSEMQVKDTKPVAVMDWNGPEFGPYKILGFNDVPEQIMPLGPASHLCELSRLINNVLRKQSRRARSGKIVHGYNAAGASGAKKAQRAGDDEWIQVEDGAEFHDISIGGVDANLQAFGEGLMGLFDRSAGNLSAMAGLGPSADTLGQEEVIQGRVSSKQANMKYRVASRGVSLIRDLGYMLWIDQFRTLRTQIPIEGAEGYTIDSMWTPEDREGDFFDYNWDIDINGMPFKSAVERLQMIKSYLTEVYAPLAPQFEAQGCQVDLQKMTDLFADLGAEPRLKQVFRFSNTMDDQPPPQGSLKPASTTRNYTRRSVPTGGTEDSRRVVRQQAWLGQNGQPSQQNALQRPPA